MLRRFRFGFLSLFAAMLLAISAAGWAKFYWDLQREEQAVIAALTEENCSVVYSRSMTDGWDQLAGEAESPSTRYFSRIRRLAILGSPSRESLRRAASLPELEALELRWESEAPSGRGPALISPEEFFGQAAPAFRSPELVEADLHQPQATGELMSESETAETLAAIRDAWREPAVTPQRFVRIAERMEFGFFESRSLDIFGRDGTSSISYRWSDGGGFIPLAGSVHWLQVDDGKALFDLRDGSEGWRVDSRYGDASREYDMNRYEPKDELVDWTAELPSRLDVEELRYVESIERIDDVRVRLIFRPFERVEPLPGYERPMVLAASIILRKDLDWRPESIRESIDDPDSADAEERRYHRVGDYVLPIEILRGPIPANDSNFVIGVNERTRFAWRIDPTFDSASFSPNRFLSEPLPPSRTLPLWRWYYGTFAVGAACVLYLAGRNAMVQIRKTDPIEADPV